MEIFDLLRGTVLEEVLPSMRLFRYPPHSSSPCVGDRASNRPNMVFPIEVFSLWYTNKSSKKRVHDPSV